MSNEKPAILVNDVKKHFKIPLDKTSGIKQLIVNFYKRKKGYRYLKALDGVSFEVRRGEFFGVVGRNGSGKSTLLKILAGVYNPDSGDVQVNGSLTPFIELGVGFNHELTGRENVFLNGALLGFSRKEMEAMYDEIVDFAELHDFMEERLKNYSSGMQVRLAFSIAIRADTDILILDEVLAVGDAAFQQKCFDYFKHLRNDNKTIILVTHDMAAVKRFCTNAVYIKNGKILAAGSPFNIADMYLVENAENLMKSDGGMKNTSDYVLEVSTQEETPSKIVLKFKYSSPDKKGMYIGISLSQNGVSIAEITTDPETPLTGKGTISYTLDKKLFNSGMYEIDSVLCTIDGRRLLNVGSNRIDFAVRGNDIRRGAALKLNDTWA